MVSPDAASEIACPMVAQAVAFVLQLLPSSPLTPSTYHVLASAEEDSIIRTPRIWTTVRFSMVILPRKPACDGRPRLKLLILITDREAPISYTQAQAFTMLYNFSL